MGAAQCASHSQVVEVNCADVMFNRKKLPMTNKSESMIFFIKKIQINKSSVFK